MKHYEGKEIENIWRSEFKAQEDFDQTGSLSYLKW